MNLFMQKLMNKNKELAMKKTLTPIVSAIIFMSISFEAKAQDRVFANQEMVKALSQAVMKQVTQMAIQMRPVYEKLKTCTPAENNYIAVYGLEEDLCHFKYVNYDCYVPLDIAEKYATSSLQSLDEILNSDTMPSKESINARYAEEVLFNKTYCKEDKSSAGIENLKLN